MTRPPRRGAGRLVVALAAGGALLAGDGAAAPDRLERFRELAATRPGLGQLVDVDIAPEVEREIYALLDEEVVESLAAGGIYASIAFLQDRLDAFGEAWGAVSLRVMRAGPLVVGAFQLHDPSRVNSLRVYGRLRGEPALLTSIHRQGRPIVYPLAPAADGGAQLLVAWEGASSGRGTRALRLELVGQSGPGARVTWSTDEALGEGLLARAWGVAGGEVRIRYEVRYPGWTPGCEGQTESEDVYRLGPGGAMARVSRRYHNAWHRDFRAAAQRFFEAVTGGNRSALAALVPDARLRGRLPAALEPEPACDAPEGTGPERVSVAATAAGGPWQLTFQRAASRWQLVSASPVIP